MTDQIAQLSIQTGEVIAKAAGYDAANLVEVFLLVAAAAGDQLNAEDDRTPSVLFLAGLMEALDTLGRQGVAGLNPTELAILQKAAQQ